MQINKSIKQAITMSLLVSCLSCTVDVNAIRSRRRYPINGRYPTNRSSSADIVTSLAALGIGALIATAGIAVSTYFAYQRAKEQYALLSRFQDDPYYGYDQLKDDARNLYYSKCGSSSTSLSNDYPAIWLEKDATSNKNFLWWMFFSSDMKKLSNNLDSVIRCLRNCEQFKDDRTKYNKAYREQHYRDERLAIEREKLDQKKEQNRRR